MESSYRDVTRAPGMRLGGEGGGGGGGGGGGLELETDPIRRETRSNDIIT